MTEYTKLTTFNFLPISREDMLNRDWYYYDFLLITGDAYVDHPSFGAAVIGRVLESKGYRVAILSQPNFIDLTDIISMGKPRYAALITAGNLDSMVAHYTAAKKKRNDDYYSSGKKAGKRPDRAVTVYSKLVREAFPDLPIIIGGLEASLRRFAHYDYWEDKVYRSILFDSGADLLIYGMGEKAIVEVANRLAKGEKVKDLTNILGTGYIADESNGDNSFSILSQTSRLDPFPQETLESSEQNVFFGGLRFKDRNDEFVLCPSFEEVSKSKEAYAIATKIQHEENDPIRGKTIIQECEGKILVINPPQKTPTTEELDKTYALPFTREVHPVYKSLGGVPAIDEVRFSVIHNRGCFGACNFCALAFHQGKTVASRSHESVIKEVEGFINHPDFKGYVHDVGGPTANFRKPACKKQKEHGTCIDKNCLVPPCDNLDVNQVDYLILLKKVAAIKGVKKVFVRSGIRYDYMLLDKNGEFFTELVKNHISGQLKVAPEHITNNVLHCMNKPNVEVYEKFKEKYKRLNDRYNKKQFLVPYLMSSHPGSTVHDAIALAEYLNKERRQPEQVQDFYPTPGTISTCMYYTGLNPFTLKPIHVPRSKKEKTTQRALLQWKNPKNRNIVLQALKEANREDLIGFSKKHLVRPR